MLGNTSDPLGLLLKRFRTRRHLTQQQLATALGVHRSTIGRWEAGSVLPESKALVLDLAKHLHLDEQETRQLLEASLTALTPHWSVPYPRNPYFTGREEILEALHTQLGVDQTVALTQSSALQGLGGVGKTQIALEYAYRYALEYSAVFWIEAETGERITASLLRLADVLGLPERYDSDQQQVLRAVQRWLTTHHHWLLIWDNLQDPTVLSDFLPPARQGVLLLTTRRAALGTLAQGIELLPMRQDEGLVFVLRRAKVLSPAQAQQQLHTFAACSPAEYAAAEEVITILGRLPLALDQAAAYIDETRCGFSGYLQRYEQQRSQVLDRRGALSTDHPQSVVSTFMLAYRQVARRNPAALELLRFCAWLSPDAIPEELLLAYPTCLGPVLGPVAADPFQFDQALGVLLGLSLVHRHAETRMLSLHRLVQIVLREAMNEHEQTQWLLRVLQSLARLFPEVHPEIPATDPAEVWKQCERLLPHVQAVSTALTADPGTQELAVVLDKAADYLREREQYEQAEPCYERVLRICQQQLGSDHPLAIRALNGLANLSLQQGKFERAEGLCQQALLLQKQAGRSDSPSTIASLITLADLQGWQGKYTEAESLLRRALSIGEQIFGPKHPRAIEPLSLLGLFYWRQGKYIQAEPLLQQALSIGEQTFGPAHLQLVSPLTNLGLLRWKQGKYTQAEQLCQRALDIWEQVFGFTHHRLAYLLTAVGILCAEQSKYAQAETLFQRALVIREQALGPEHPLVGRALDSLADLFAAQDKPEQAERWYLRAIALYEQRGETEPTDLAYPLHGLAKLYARQGKEAQAEVLYRRALQLREQAREDPELATALGDLAQLCLRQERYEEAEGLYQRALSLRLQSLGQRHLETAQTLYDLAMLHHQQGKRDEARSLAEQAYAICSELLGEAHPKTARAQALAAQLLWEPAGAQKEVAAPRDAEETSLTLRETADLSNAENNALQPFLTACCELHPRAWCRSADLWQAYQQWSREHQERYPLSRGAFIAQLKRLGCRADRTMAARIWRGIAVVKKEP